MSGPAGEILHLEQDAEFLVSLDHIFYRRDEPLLVVLIGKLAPDLKPDDVSATFRKSFYHTGVFLLQVESISALHSQDTLKFFLVFDRNHPFL